VILALVVIAIGVSYGVSTLQTKQYQATASYQVQAQSQGLGIVDIPPSLSAQTPAQLASQAAQMTLQPDVIARARRMLSSEFRSLNFAQSVTASVNPDSTNVDVQATARTPTGAAAVANAFAAAVVQATNDQQRAQYAADAAQIAKRHVAKSDVAGAALQQEEVTRLQQLAAIASPAQVVARATTPTAPSSPKPLRNAAIAGFLGLMVGLLIVYVWDSLDRRLKSSGEVERQLPFPLVGHVRTQALGRTLAAGQQNHAVESVDWEQFRIMRRNLELIAGDAPAQTMCVTSAVSQEGKTTVALFVAFAAAAAGRRTLFLECDLRRPVVAERIGINAAPGVSDFVAGTAQLSEIVQSLPFTDPIGRNGAAQDPAQTSQDALTSRMFQHELACITAGTHTDYPTQILESRRFRELMDEARHSYELVVLDTPPLLPVVDTLEVIGTVDVILLCARIQRVRRDQARLGRQMLGRLPHRPVGLVVTGISHGEEYYDRDYYGYRSKSGPARIR
jgi:receptor protein-tyrosine kinase